MRERLAVVVVDVVVVGSVVLQFQLNDSAIPLRLVPIPFSHASRWESRAATLETGLVQTLFVDARINSRNLRDGDDDDEDDDVTRRVKLRLARVLLRKNEPANTSASRPRWLARINASDRAGHKRQINSRQ